MRPLKIRILLGAVAALNGCAITPTTTPKEPLPSAFANQDPRSPAIWPVADWYRAFGSAALDELIADAARTNLDVEEARARVLQADARARQAGAALLPTLDATGTGNFYSGHSSQGAGHEFDWSAMLSASYELDFWGKNRATVRSTQFQAAAARTERDTVALTTVAGVADTYFQIVAVRERIRIATANRDTAQRLVAVVQARFDAGAAGQVELATQKTIYESTKTTIAELEQSEVESRSSLALLLGRLPEGFEPGDERLAAIQDPVLSAGLPSELLTHRPDIYLAEANLLSAGADVTAARAAMLPNISLTAGAGVANPALPAAVLTIPGIGPSFALGGTLLQPIFDHGKLAAQRDEAAAKEQELLARYRSSIIAAFADVENALASLAHATQARDAGFESAIQSERAFAGAKARYEAGAGDYLTLLEAQRILYGANDQAVQSRLAQLVAFVSLYKALGGGWHAATPAKPQPATVEVAG